MRKTYMSRRKRAHTLLEESNVNDMKTGQKNSEKVRTLGLDQGYYEKNTGQ